MRTIMMNGFCLLMLVVGLSCGRENTSQEREGQKVINAVDVKSDAEFTPTDDDLKCLHDSDCQPADQGCCSREKRMVINRDKYPAARAKIRAQCKVLSHDFYEQQKEEEKKQKGKRLEKWLCKAGGRDARSSGPDEKVECKKELPRLFLKDRAKDPKKYDDDEKIYNSTPGKCAFKQ